MNTYQKSGVNINTGNELVEEIKPLAKSTDRAGVMGGIGSFGALFSLSATGQKYINPILVSSTDGVGTKLCIAQKIELHNTIGIDLVAMCVNDILAQGAEPLFFLDYFATGKLEKSIAISVIEGIAEGCKEAQVALVGGETAEMPGVYEKEIYDLAGFAVGIVEKDRILPKDIKEGDVLLGLASSGVHSNGYSLVRKIYDANPKEFNIKELMAPTKIYVKALLPLVKKGLVKGMAHITGGGITENLPRITGAEIKRSSWEFPELFKKLQKFGNVAEEEMLRTFNCGIGMVVAVAPENKQAVIKALNDSGETAFEIGTANKTDIVKYV